MRTWDRHRPRPHLVLGLALFLGVVLLYWPSTSHEFLNYDDDTYVTANDEVRAGLSAAGVAWAFSTFRASNWHPLTWISHMIDIELFGMDPGGHHAVSLLLHAASALLLLVTLRAATGALWRSAAAAAIFALHPLRVESVAWAAERKDVLSLLFGLLAIAAYLRYTRKPRTARYAAVVGLHACSLLAKPTLVTLPALLLLLDFWPLGRMGPSQASSPPPARRRLAGWLIAAEKAPLVLLSLASSVATLHAQALSGTLSSLAAYPVAERLANVATHYGRYLGKILWPSGLAVFYPLEEAPGGWHVASSLALLALITVVVVESRRRFPFLAAGWLWFLVALVPVCGLVQVGAQSIADRYTYLPGIGLCLLAAWGGRECAGRDRSARLLPPLAAVLCLALAAATSRQLQFWRDSATLFQRAAEITDRNWVAQYRLGLALEGRGRPVEAEERYREALRLRPHDGWVLYRLGGLAMQAGREHEALDLYQRALRDPASPAETENNLGVIMARQNRLREAEAFYRRALERRPSYLQARVNLGLTLASAGRMEEALAAFREVLGAEPGHPGAQAAMRLIFPGGLEPDH